MNKVIIKLILVIIMLSYIIFLIWNASQLSCTECTITFNEMGFKETYNMSDLFNLTKDTTCPIYWDRVQGYVKS